MNPCLRPFTKTNGLWGVGCGQEVQTSAAGSPRVPELLDLHLRSHLTQSAFQVVSQKSIPTQIRPLILHISDSQGKVEGFVGELTYAKRL